MQNSQVCWWECKWVLTHQPATKQKICISFDTAIELFVMYYQKLLASMHEKYVQKTAIDILLVLKKKTKQENG